MLSQSQEGKRTRSGRMWQKGVQFELLTRSFLSNWKNGSLCLLKQIKCNAIYGY